MVGGADAKGNLGPLEARKDPGTDQELVKPWQDPGRAFFNKGSLKKGGLLTVTKPHQPVPGQAAGLGVAEPCTQMHRRQSVLQLAACRPAEGNGQPVCHPLPFHFCCVVSPGPVQGFLVIYFYLVVFILMAESEPEGSSISAGSTLHLLAIARAGPVGSQESGAPTTSPR